MSVFFSGQEALEVALEIEKNGVSFYDSLKKATKDSTAKDAYSYLDEEERRHILAFQRMLDSLGRYQPSEGYPDEHILYVKALADSRVFTDSEALLKAAQSVRNDVEAIGIALGFEKDSILLFSEMRGLVRREHQKALEAVIGEEKSHVRILSELRRKLTEAEGAKAARE